MFWRHQQAIHESFLHENLIFHQFAKVFFFFFFSHKSFLLYGMYTIPNCQCVDRVPHACSLSCCTVNEGGQLPIMLTNKLIVYFFCVSLGGQELILKAKIVIQHLCSVHIGTNIHSLVVFSTCIILLFCTRTETMCRAE